MHRWESKILIMNWLKTWLALGQKNASWLEKKPNVMMLKIKTKGIIGIKVFLNRGLHDT